MSVSLICLREYSYSLALVPQPDHPTFPKASSIPASLSSSSSGQGRIMVHTDESKLPAIIYRPTEKKISRRPSSQRACAVNIEGLWVDKADLCCGASHIIVHECQWAHSSNPCGMWIIGSRSRVGDHIRKWHKQSVTNRGKCLWDGCPKTMLEGSINRHVVTVHLGEGFFCQGCHQTYSRKDVYDQHVAKEEACKDAGAMLVYGTERRAIDTRQALHGGNATRYVN